MHRITVLLQTEKKITQIFQKYTCSVNASSGRWTSRVKPDLGLTVYDKLLCKSKYPVTVSDDQLSVGWRWENVEFSFPPIPINLFPFP